ncbi:hypothetical protein BDF21DRAFT_341031, partial [Thamnidium elegans]
TVDNQNQLDLSLIDSILKYQSQNKFTQEWIDKQRLNVLQLLEKNRIPFQYQEPVIHVLGSARVEYPYVATSVVCDNALIRKRYYAFLITGTLDTAIVFDSSVCKSYLSYPYCLLKLASANRVFNRYII